MSVVKIFNDRSSIYVCGSSSPPGANILIDSDDNIKLAGFGVPTRISVSAAVD